MEKSKILNRSFIDALGVVIYITAIALFLSNGEKVFGHTSSFLLPLFMMLLLIVSASVTGFLVLGKPVQLYLDNQKKDALNLLWSTLAWLVGLAVIIIVYFALR